MKNEIVKLPDEIQEIALKVSDKKQKEVKTVLNQIFTGTLDWEKKVNAIKIKNINDTMSIQMADVARKNAKSARLQAEKLFDIKRSEVQEKMADYKLEDQLWLKAKQIMQLKFKAIEEKAKIKSEFVKRYEAEQLNLRNDLRYEKVLKFIPDENISILEINVMSDETFNIYLSGIEKAYNDKIEAEKKAEKERIAKEKEEIAERKRIAKENEQLKKEAIEHERIAKIEANKRIKEEKERQLKAEKERKEREAKAKIEREKHEAELKKEREAKEKIEIELKLKAEKERKEKEAKLKAEKEARLAPDKDKLIMLSKEIQNLKFPKVNAIEAINILENVQVLLIKTSNYINEKVENI